MTTGSFYSKVAGVTVPNANGRSRQDYIRAFCKPHMRLILRRETDNPKDKNAIAVWVKARVFFLFSHEVQIGYLSAEVASEIAPFIDNGGEVTGEIAEVTGGSREKPTLGVNIRITKA
jgi:hypothetical protein